MRTKEMFMELQAVTPEEFGKRTKFVRVLAGMSGKALAEASGATPSTISWIEHAGARSVDIRYAFGIANAVARRGMLKKAEPREVLDFLQGLRDDLPTQMSYFPENSHGLPKEAA